MHHDDYGGYTGSCQAVPGKVFSELGVNVSAGRSQEIFKWFPSHRRSSKDRRTALALLKEAWDKAGIKNKDFPDFEAALVRAGIVLRRGKRREPAA